jgi:hypothetical protein
VATIIVSPSFRLWTYTILSTTILVHQKRRGAPPQLGLAPSLPSTEFAPPFALLFDYRILLPIPHTDATFSFLITIIQGRFHLITPKYNNPFMPGPDDNEYDVVSAHGRHRAVL